jgi:hypothetical protein
MSVVVHVGAFCVLAGYMSMITYVRGLNWIHVNWIHVHDYLCQRFKFEHMLS